MWEVRGQAWRGGQRGTLATRRNAGSTFPAPCLPTLEWPPTLLAPPPQRLTTPCWTCARTLGCAASPPSLRAGSTSGATLPRFEPWERTRWAGSLSGGASRRRRAGGRACPLCSIATVPLTCVPVSRQQRRVDGGRLHLYIWFPPGCPSLSPGLPRCPPPPPPPPPLQVRLVLGLLQDHPGLELVVVSDSDIVWLREPWTYFEQVPEEHDWERRGRAGLRAGGAAYAPHGALQVGSSGAGGGGGASRCRRSSVPPWLPRSSRRACSAQRPTFSCRRTACPLR